MLRVLKLMKLCLDQIWALIIGLLCNPEIDWCRLSSVITSPYPVSDKMIDIVPE